ncbi:MAG: TIGR03564 family F420-dependent LLM class oxidoreductase [Acidimicrobiia bacterium]|nr:TIGR03564 family F420-dependent LLM class oxidoreductase [Acidimicrobiia bacterium]
MDIGIFFQSDDIDKLVERARLIRDDGFSTLWVPQIFGVDSLTALAVVAREVPDLHFGTAVVPTYPRHPAMLAAQAATVSRISGGRFTLGIGLSHQVVIEGMFGLSFEKPVRHLREYLDVLLPLLAGEPVNASGETLTFRGGLSFEAPRTPVLVAALGPQMLRLAGSRADGTSTWMTGPRTLADHVVPTITAAAEKPTGRSTRWWRRSRYVSPTTPAPRTPAPPRSSRSTAPFPPTGPCSTAEHVEGPAPTWRSSARPTRWPTASTASPMPAPPTSTPRSSATATSAPPPGRPSPPSTAADRRVHRHPRTVR